MLDKLLIMKRTRYPAKIRSDVAKITPDDIMESITHTEKARLLTIQTEIQARLINIKIDVYCIGELLYEAKGTLSHGMFIPWIEHTFDKELPYPTAHFYMKIYDVFKKHPKTIQLIPSKYLLMITSRKFPKEIVALLNKHPEKIDDNSLQQINELYDEFKSGEIGNSQFLRLAERQISLGIDIWKGRAKHRLDANMRQSLNFGAKDVLKRINYLRKLARDMSGVFPYDPDNPEHQKLIAYIDKTITGLQELKSDLESDKFHRMFEDLQRGLFKPVSTKDGDKFISNL